jgi:putative membrane protein
MRASCPTGGPAVRHAAAVAGSRFDAWVRSVGSDPDPRFTLANERTFLTWMTTALGLLGVGLAVGTVVPGKPVPALILACLWIALSAVVALRALGRWFVLERAMRTDSALPLSRSIPALALGLGILAIATGVVLGLGV